MTVVSCKAGNAVQQLSTRCVGKTKDDADILD